MSLKHPMLLRVVGVVAAVPLLMLGLLSLGWAVVFLVLDGPSSDLRLGESIAFGFGLLTLATAAVAAAVRLLRRFRAPPVLRPSDVDATDLPQSCGRRCLAARVVETPMRDPGRTDICSDSRLGFKEGLPAVICIGQTFQQPDTLLQFVGKFNEPVLLIWSDLLADLSADTALEDSAVWEKKRQEFARVLGRYQQVLRFDERRVYLTGFSFAGAYAWMLAYDRPDLYAGVVAMSAASYPQPIRQRLDSAKSVVTVVIRGEKDSGFQKHREQEQRTGQAIEARNPHSKFVLKPGEGHRETAKHWIESLSYVLQFRKPGPSSVNVGSIRPAEFSKPSEESLR